MPPRKRATPGVRAGARPGVIAPEVLNAMRAEAKRLEELGEPLARAQAVGDFFAAVDAEMSRIARVRARAINELKDQGMSQTAIGRDLGMSKQRVAQISKDPRFQ